MVLKKPFKELQLSTLGMGCMRLPATSRNWGAPIDNDAAMKIIDYAYNNGVNFFDTSWFYHNGDSERFIGEALKRYPRDTWYLSSKLAGMMMQNVNGRYQLSGSNKDNRIFYNPTEIFEYQAQRCGVDYFDFYMLHNVSEGSYDIYTDKGLGIIEAMLKLKEAGHIKYFGLSSHGRADTIEKFLLHTRQHFGDIFDFGMIQINYMDWKLQKAGDKYDVLTKYNLPVIAMEPLRGGTLARLNEKANGQMKAVRPDDSQAAWAFRHLQSLDNIVSVLSGMSDLAQIQENVTLFGKHDPTTPAEDEMLQQVLESIVDLVPCTSCDYCMENCPQKLDIPMLLTMFNEAGYEMGWFLQVALKNLKEHEKPTACTLCGQCVPVCPQEIDIPEILRRFSKIITE
ncbi:MAG: aldo/keto reductase [Defluviitaleaceae bacterium]|nr:aldo/keto reductase [Defluviitaleaceae bacterium]MCL2275106.1 aldo/keto reductase [Defluviitaleaceae bacterium]